MPSCTVTASCSDRETSASRCASGPTTRAAREGRGDDSGIAHTNVKSRMQETYSAEGLAALVEMRHLQIDQGRGRTVDGHIELFDTLTGPKKLDIGSYPPMHSRPWVEEHDRMFRWYEYWLKGVDNGIMDEPA